MSLPASTSLSTYWQKGFVPIFFVIGILVIAALSVGTLMFFRSTQPKPKAVSPTSDTIDSTSSAQEVPAELPVEEVSDAGSCDSACQNYIDSKLAILKQDLLKQIQSAKAVQPITTTSQTTTTTSSNNQPKEIFVGMGAGGSTTSVDWTDVSGSTISFNPSNYPGATGFYFQANLKSDAQDRTAYARIYDDTHNVGVIGSDIEFTGIDSTLKESDKLTFLSGTLTLRIQIHSLNVNQSTIENPRIKVAY